MYALGSSTGLFGGYHWKPVKHWYAKSVAFVACLPCFQKSTPYYAMTSPCMLPALFCMDERNISSEYATACTPLNFLCTCH